jgi:hypothetical protein
MMKALDFAEVVDLINRSRTTEIDINPIVSEKGKWSLFKGINKVPNFSYPFHILYLYSDFAKESINRAIQSITIPKSTQVVYAPSVKDTYIFDFKQAVKRNKRDPSGVLDLKTYLSSFIQDQMRSYTDKLKNIKPQFFIDPFYDTPAKIKAKYPNPLSLFFTDNTEDVKDGALAILLAEPGQGKTYSAQYLANALSEKDYIPIYIHSSQWATMQEGDLSSLYKTIIHSFRYYDSSIDWIEGEEEKFIKVTLRVGLFRIIFDGFDEYILWNNGKISADETIKTLHELVQNSSARVLVTSRTTFWNSSITVDEELSSIYKYSIQPFDTNQARNYFTKRFIDNIKSIDKSTKVFITLQNSTKSGSKNAFVGRGIILSLIADLCSDDIDVSTYDENLSVWQWIINALCQREERRQQLPINADKQLDILRMFVEEKAKGQLPSSTLLRDIISLHCDTLTSEQINLLLGDSKNRGKLTDHPLITKDHNTELWSFKHEQIEFNLIAELVINYAKENNSNSIKTFFEQLVVKGSILDDLTIVLIEQLNVKNDKNSTTSFNSLLCNLKSCISTESHRPKLFSSLSIVLSKIIISYVNKNNPIGSSEKIVRTTELLKMIGQSQINGYHFTGTLASFDFVGVNFYNCIFENIVWTNCRFNVSTIFDNCSFIGGEIHNCEDFGNANFSKDCDFDRSATISVNYEKIKYGSKKVDSDDIKRDLVMFIRKFVPRDGVFKIVYEDGLFKGHLAISPYKNELIPIMKKYVVDENLDDSGHFYKIKPAARDSINHYFNNGIFSGELARAFNELLRKFKID